MGDLKEKDLLNSGLNVTTRAVRRSCILVNNIHYYSEDLTPYGKETNKVKVAWDSEDVSYCYVYIEQEEKWVKILAVCPSVNISGKSITEWKCMISDQREKQRVQEDFISKYIGDLVEEYYSNMVHKKIVNN